MQSDGRDAISNASIELVEKKETNDHTRRARAEAKVIGHSLPGL